MIFRYIYLIFILILTFLCLIPPISIDCGVGYMTVCICHISSNCTLKIREFNVCNYIQVEKNKKANTAIS